MQTKWDTLTPEQRETFKTKMTELRKECQRRFEQQKESNQMYIKSKPLTEADIEFLDSLTTTETPTEHFKPYNATSQWLDSSQTEVLLNGQRCLLAFEGGYFRIGIWIESKGYFREDLPIDASGMGMVFTQKLERFAVIYE